MERRFGPQLGRVDPLDFKLQGSFPTRSVVWMRREHPKPRAGSVPPYMSHPAGVQSKPRRSWLANERSTLVDEAAELQQLKDLAFDYSRPLARVRAPTSSLQRHAVSLNATTRSPTALGGSMPEAVQPEQQGPEPRQECLNFPRRAIGFARQGPSSGRRGTRRLRIDTAKCSYEAVSETKSDELGLAEAS